MYDSLNELLIVDVESSCWGNENNRPKNETNDIIEVGISVVNLMSLQIEKTESILVVPERSKISKYCTDLTTLTQAQVDAGVSFKIACEMLEDKYNSRNLTWGSWGQYDRKMFEMQCRDLCVPYPFSRNHINLKNIFSVFYGLNKELNVPTALDYLDMPFVGTLHRGDADSFNIANIFIQMTKKVRKA